MNPKSTWEQIFTSENVTPVRWLKKHIFTIENLSQAAWVQKTNFHVWKLYSGVVGKKQIFASENFTLLGVEADGGRWPRCVRDPGIQGGQRATAWNADGGGRLGSPGFLDFGPPGGCASSRLDHSFHIPSRTHSRQPMSWPCNIETIYPREWRIAIPASLNLWCELTTHSSFWRHCPPTTSSQLILLHGSKYCMVDHSVISEPTVSESTALAVLISAGKVKLWEGLA